MLDSPHLRGRDRYERFVDGWIASTHDDAFTHTVRLTDDDLGVELSAVATPSPSYEIREAAYRLRRGAESPAFEPLAGLSGVRMVGGFTSRIGEVVAGLPAAGALVAAAVEIARLARQVTRLPPERAARAAAGPWECWQLDTTSWIDLPDSCFTYSDAGRALFGTREVVTPLVPALYAPPPGQPRVFERRKVARLVRRDSRLELSHSMHDNVHGIEIRYEIDLARSVIVAADSATPRLPYTGICTEPQGRISLLVGETVDASLRKRMQALIGGSTGCAQLYDLTADLLRLLGLY